MQFLSLSLSLFQSKLRGINFKWMLARRKEKKHIIIYLRIKERHHKGKTKQKIDISAHAINNNSNSNKARELSREKIRATESD